MELTLDTLPADVLAGVGSWLPPAGFSSLRSVCRAARAALPCPRALDLPSPGVASLLRPYTAASADSAVASPPASLRQLHTLGSELARFSRGPLFAPELNRLSASGSVLSGTLESFLAASVSSEGAGEQAPLLAVAWPQWFSASQVARAACALCCGAVGQRDVARAARAARVLHAIVGGGMGSQRRLALSTEAMACVAVAAEVVLPAVPELRGLAEAVRVAALEAVRSAAAREGAEIAEAAWLAARDTLGSAGHARAHGRDERAGEGLADGAHVAALPAAIRMAAAAERERGAAARGSAGVAESPLWMASLGHCELARLLAAVDIRAMQAIDAPDLLTWSVAHSSASIQRNIALFNAIANAAARIVLVRPETDEARAEALARMVLTAKELVSLGEFNAAVAVISGLNCSAVSRLRRSWARVKRSLLSDFEALMGLCSPSRSYRELRIRCAQHCLLPFLGVSLVDLAFIQDTADSARSSPLPSTRALCSADESAGFVEETIANYEKMEMIFVVLKGVLDAMHRAHGFGSEIDPELVRRATASLTGCPPVSDEELFRLSHIAEPR
eukprot:m51a1_g7289 putative ras guanyl-releasing protein 3 (563) ;mRNA; r:47918-49606